ncbi:MAG: MoaD/ThiS family protein [Gemmataceae bacterium]|nr:MoaD/ThiS family protein [Gemmataceae bacterium]
MMIELFGVPRQMAGRAEAGVFATTVRQALFALAEECPGIAKALRSDGSLLPQYLVSLNGERFLGDFDETLPPDSRLLLLSADAGG